MASLTKVFVILGVFVALVSYMIYIPVSPDMAEPWRFRILSAMMSSTFTLGSIAERLGIGSRLSTIRHLSDVVARISSPSVSPLLVERRDIYFNGFSTKIRIYKPRAMSKSPRAGLVFYHGGGWVLGSVDSHDHVAAFYAVSADIVVVSVEYRLAPEFPFPFAFEDCVSATRYFINHAASENVDPTRIAVGGDSAGGNLAAAVSLYLRDNEPQLMPKAQVLIYPVLQLLDSNTPSFFEARKYQLITGYLHSSYSNT